MTLPAASANATLGSDWEDLGLYGLSPRTLASVAYDPVDRLLIAFGGEGQGNTCFGETWAYANGSWSALSPPNGTEPTPRAGAGLAFDPSTNTTVLFGGYTTYDRAQGYLLNDTWEFSGGVWRNVTASAGAAPKPRWDAAMDTDASDDGVLLFGGRADTGSETATGTPRSDTWLFRNGTWSRLSTGGQGAPAARYGAAASEGPGGAVFVYSGSEGSSGYAYDLWRFESGAWALVDLPHNQAGELQDATLMESDRGDLLLFGGCLPAPVTPCTPASPLFALNLTAGGFVLVSGTFPSVRWGAAGAYDPASNSSVVFCGQGGLYGNTPLAQAWSYASGSGWEVAPVSVGSPPALAGVATTFDPTLGGVLAFGGGFGSGSSFDGVGTTPATASNSTWLFAHGSWRALTQPNATAPSARWDAGLAYDAHDGYDVLFGGIALTCTTAGCVRNDTWLFANGSWRPLPTPAGGVTGPPTLSGFSMAYDDQLGCVVLFGGRLPRNVDSNQTWLFCDGSWTDATGRLAPSPPPREGAMMAYDSVRDAMVLFGGYLVDAPKPYRDLWELTNGSWSLVVPMGVAPGPVVGGTFVDTGRSSLLFFGGVVSPTAAPALSNTSWEFNGTAWENVSSGLGAAPSPRFEANGAFDAADGYDVLFSGCTNLGCSGGPSDTWSVGYVPPLHAALVADRSTVDEGGSLNLTVVRSGGSGNTTAYEYTGLPSGCGSRSVAVLHCTPNATGSWNVSVTIDDALHQRASSPLLVLRVADALVSAVTVPLTAVDVGQSFSVVGSSTGGVPPVQVVLRGLPPGCVAGGPTLYHCTPTVAGNYTIVATASDATGTTASSVPAVVTVAGAFAITVGATPSTLDAGSRMVLSATTVGGSAPYLYEWGGLPPGCLAQDTAQLSCAPASAGTYDVTIAARDAADESASATLTLSVSLPPFGAIVVDAPASCTAPFVTQLTAQLGGGVPPLTYDWSFGDGTNATGAPTLPHAYATPGRYTVGLDVIDALGVGAAFSTNLTLTPSCAPAGGGTALGPASSNEAPLIAFDVAVAVVTAAVFVRLLRRGPPPGPRARGQPRRAR